MRSRSTALLCVIVAALASVPPAAAQSDYKLVQFKDGFIVEGRLRRDNTYIVDPASKTMVRISVPNGFYHVEDAVRNIIFSPRQVNDLVKAPERKDQVRFWKTPGRPSMELPSSWQIEEAFPWQASNWERKISLKTSIGKLDMKQYIYSFSPEYIKVATREYDWKSSYLPDELGPEKVRRLLYEYLATQKKYDKKFDRTMTVYRFLLQAGWTDAAERELEGALKDFRQEKTRLGELQDALKKYRTLQFIEDLEKAAKLGQHSVVRAGLKRYAEEKMEADAGDQSINKVLEIRTKYKELDRQIAQAKHQLGRLPARKVNEAFFKQAGREIIDELNEDTVGRLEVFLSQAAAFDLALKNKQKPKYQSTEQLLSLAVTGWVLGNGAAEEKVSAARELWQARQLLLDYLRADDKLTRDNKLVAMQKLGLRPDVAARALLLLPPEPFDKLDEPQPFKVEAERAGGLREPYFVQLPPDYRHVGRTYPVLIVLHNTAETPKESLKRWEKLAAKYGFILAAPAWLGKREFYTYSEREHAAVLDCLRDLRRRFAVDSDRVLLFGSEEGARMAFDVGLSHPDQFAGVMPMAAPPKYFAFRYWSNAQYLPFYVVNGERSGEAGKFTKALLKDWVRCNYPVLHVEYKGRAMEMFEGEPKYLMDWMSRKRRANPAREVGIREQEFKTMRPTDNRFYWLATPSGPDPRCQNQAGVGVWQQATTPATLRGSISKDNTISVIATGVPDVTIWLGPGMLAYNEKGAETKVTVHVNRITAMRKVTPNLGLLLEHVYQTGDRQRLYWARIDVKL